MGIRWPDSVGGKKETTPKKKVLKTGQKKKTPLANRRHRETTSDIISHSYQVMHQLPRADKAYNLEGGGLWSPVP